MGTFNRATTIAVLRVLRDQGDTGATRAFLESKLPHVADMRRTVNNLRTQHMASSTRLHDGSSLYHITSHGIALIRRAEAPTTAKGDIPAPRTFIPQGPYIPAAIHTREGSQDFLACESRRGSELVPHRLPISMAGGGE